MIECIIFKEEKGMIWEMSGFELLKKLLKKIATALEA